MEKSSELKLYHKIGDVEYYGDPSICEEIISAENEERWWEPCDPAEIITADNEEIGGFDHTDDLEAMNFSDDVLGYIKDLRKTATKRGPLSKEFDQEFYDLVFKYYFN